MARDQRHTQSIRIIIVIVALVALVAVNRGRYRAAIGASRCSAM